MLTQSNLPPLTKLNTIHPNGYEYTDLFKPKDKSVLGLMVLCANCQCPCTKIEAAGTLQSSRKSVSKQPIYGTSIIGDALLMAGTMPELSASNQQISVVLSCEQCNEWSAIVFTQEKGVIRLVSHCHVARFEEYAGQDEAVPLQSDVASNYSGLLEVVNN